MMTTIRGEQRADADVGIQVSLILSGRRVRLPSLEYLSSVLDDFAAFGLLRRFRRVLRQGFEPWSLP